MKNRVTTPTHLILHGHFYQPPRENPLVDLIPKQNSASPYLDWNERIFDDCYRANAFSRYLDPKGRVVDIINNYEYISFNFGPTLLSWIEKHHRHTYKKILEADRLSLQRLGFGNAIAQVYNHTILPLDTIEDARTQIVWGLEDFRSRFQREADGMWLSETAISPQVVSLLVQEGVKFVILSPFQCKAVEQEDGSFKPSLGSDLLSGESFIIKGVDNEELNAFFYHGQLASSISFGHMLRDADAMYNSLLEIQNGRDAPLLHTATDGEIYGHHEPFGDMALAALIKKVESNGHFVFSNYASELERRPSKRVALLFEGEEKKGSSWSCSHGVSRWYKDCGCQTGGEANWNQKWRTPLREAFTLLADQIDLAFNKEMAHLCDYKVEPTEILHLYAKVLTNQMGVSQFIREVEKRWDITIEQKVQFASLLEGQRLKHYMFTSCGWFFADIAGIEPKQNIQFAVEAFTLYERLLPSPLKEQFLSILERGKSNTTSGGDGKTIALSYFELPPGEMEATLYFTLNSCVAKKGDVSKQYGKYHLLNVKKKSSSLYLLEIEDQKTLNTYDIEVELHLDHERGYSLDITSFNTQKKGQSKHYYNTSLIPPRILHTAYLWIDHSMSQIGDEEFKRIATNIRYYSFLMKRGRSAPSENLYIENMGTGLRALRSLFTTPDTLLWEQKRESIITLLEFITKRGGSNEQAIVKRIFSDEIDLIAQKIDTTGFSYAKGVYLLEILDVAYSQKVEISITTAQEALYPYIFGSKKGRVTTVLAKEVLSQLKSALNFSPLKERVGVL